VLLVKAHRHLLEARPHRVFFFAVVVVIAQFLFALLGSPSLLRRTVLTGGTASRFVFPSLLAVFAFIDDEPAASTQELFLGFAASSSSTLAIIEILIIVLHQKSAGSPLFVLLRWRPLRSFSRSDRQHRTIAFAFVVVHEEPSAFRCIFFVLLFVLLGLRVVFNKEREKRREERKSWFGGEGG
jgi:hypothetical protein